MTNSEKDVDFKVDDAAGKHSGASLCSTFEGWMAVMGYNTCTSDIQEHLREAWEAGQDPLHRKYAWLESDLSVAEERLRELYLLAHEFKRQHQLGFVSPGLGKTIDEAFQKTGVFLSNVSGYLDRIVRRFIWDRVPNCCVTPYHMKLAYMDHARCEVVMVAWPLNYVVQIAWAINLAWCRYRHKPSWIDRRIPREAADMLDWAETIICNAKPEPHAENDWNLIVNQWRLRKRGIYSANAGDDRQIPGQNATETKKDLNRHLFGRSHC